MKRFLITLIALSSLSAVAEEAVQTGTPAVLEAINGKKIKAMLQRMEDDKLVFQPVKSTRDIPVPASKVKSLEFFPKYDETAVGEMFAAGNFQGVIDAVGPMMDEFVQYMQIKNNVRDLCLLTYNSYKSLNDYENASRYAQALISTDDEALQLTGQVGLAQIALAQGDLERAAQIKESLPSDADAAMLYLTAALQRAHGDPKEAIQTVTDIIEQHPNDVDILSASELLIAYCYLDMTGTNSVISTNSAMNTARQVKNMYAGTAVAVNAAALWTKLGGPDVEAAQAAEAEAQEAERAAAAAEAEKYRAEKQAQREAEKAAEAAAAANANLTNNVTTTESE